MCSTEMEVPENRCQVESESANKITLDVDKYTKWLFLSMFFMFCIYEIYLLVKYAYNSTMLSE